jgi:FkbM family methyltransferase
LARCKNIDVNIKQSRWHQFLFDYALGIRRAFFPKFRSIAFRLYNPIIKRQRRKNRNDVFVKFKYNGDFFWINTSHRLPFTLAYHKLYSSNLPRICEHVNQKFNNLKIVDIGANIGDTVFLIKQKVDCPILCVEGNPDFLPLLKYNTKKYGNVELEECFVGMSDSSLNVKLVSDGGGTSFVVLQDEKNARDSNFSFRSLESIIESHSSYKDGFKILKIDTDGFDCEIIRTNIDFISKMRPVIFFEYAPAWIPTGKDSELKTFDVLKDVGYIYFLFYTSEGELLSFSAFDNWDAIMSFHEYLSRGRRFGDIVAVHESDMQLFTAIKKGELQFMRSYFEQ